MDRGHDENHLTGPTSQNNKPGQMKRPKKTTGFPRGIRTVLLLSACGLFLPAVLHAQARTLLTLDTCRVLAEENYPLLKQAALIEKTREYSVGNAAKGYLPQIAVYGQATYQSDVTEIPITLPNINIPKISRDQYKIYGEVTQPLTDIYTVRQQKELARANSETEIRKLEVDLYALKDRVNQLFFGILLIDAQLRQTELVRKDILSGIEKIRASIDNGTALKSDADLLGVELLNNTQRAVELRAGRKGYSDMLALFIRRQVDENTELEVPGMLVPGAEIRRPELRLYEVQKRSYDVQDRLVTAKNLPKFSLFFQGGYGRPALNLLRNNFALYYVGGARLNWNLSGFYTLRQEKKLSGIGRETLEVQRETFLLNTRLSLSQQNSEAAKYEALIGTDEEIIRLREKIKLTAKSQLENGTITAIDYLSIVNAEDQARQNMLLHRIQLLVARYNYQNTSGN